MTSQLEDTLSHFAKQAWSTAIAHHGNLGVEADLYVSRVLSVTRRHLGTRLTTGTAADFICGLHTVDLYLAIACTQSSDSAWERLTLLYQTFILRVAGALYPNSDAAHAIADSIPGHIFLPGASGASRIASYEGRSSLATWLAAVINNKVLREQRSRARWERLDSALDIPDYSAAERTEASLRTLRDTSHKFESRWTRQSTA